MKSLLDAFGRIVYLFLALLVSFLPEKIKEHDFLLAYNRPGIQIFSGLLVFLTALGFIIGQFLYQVQHSANQNNAVLLNQNTPQSTVANPYMLLGVAALTLYAVQPLSLVCEWMILEGFTRSLCATISEERYGSALIALPYRLIVFLRRILERSLLKVRLGPSRPDTVIPPDRTKSGLLEILSSTDKGWSCKQVVRYREELYILNKKVLKTEVNTGPTVISFGKC